MARKRRGAFIFSQMSSITIEHKMTETTPQYTLYNAVYSNLAKMILILSYTLDIHWSQQDGINTIPCSKIYG